jgi:hypothetical protein
MTLGQNPFNPSRTLPTLAAILHRRRDLLAYQARQEAAQALATPNELPTEEETPVPEEFHFTQEQEEQQENDELQEPYADEESEPSVVLPPRSSAPPHRDGANCSWFLALPLARPWYDDQATRALSIKPCFI